MHAAHRQDSLDVHPFSAPAVGGRGELAPCVHPRSETAPGHSPCRTSQEVEVVPAAQQSPAKSCAQLDSAALVRVKLYYFWSLTLLMALLN